MQAFDDKNHIFCVKSPFLMFPYMPDLPFPYRPFMPDLPFLYRPYMGDPCPSTRSAFSLVSVQSWRIENAAFFRPLTSVLCLAMYRQVSFVMTSLRHPVMTFFLKFLFFLQKYLHIPKICCNFAPSFRKD